MMFINKYPQRQKNKTNPKSMKIINLFTIPHRIQYQKDCEVEKDCKAAKSQNNQSEMTDGKVDESKFSTTIV